MSDDRGTRIAQSQFKHRVLEWVSKCGRLNAEEVKPWLEQTFPEAYNSVTYFISAAPAYRKCRADLSSLFQLAFSDGWKVALVEFVDVMTYEDQEIVKFRRHYNAPITPGSPHRVNTYYDCEGVFSIASGLWVRSTYNQYEPAKNQLISLIPSDNVAINTNKTALLAAEKRVEARRTGITVTLNMNPLSCANFVMRNLNSCFWEFTKTRPLKLYEYSNFTHWLAIICEVVNTLSIFGRKCMGFTLFWNLVQIYWAYNLPIMFMKIGDELPPYFVMGILIIWLSLTLLYVYHLSQALSLQRQNRKNVPDMFKYAIRFDLFCQAFTTMNDFWTFQKFTDYSFTQAQRTEMASAEFQARLTRLKQIKGTIEGEEVEVMFYSYEFEAHLTFVWYSLFNQLIFVLSVCNLLPKLIANVI